VAVPGDVRSTVLSVPNNLRPTITICKVTFWEKIGLKKVQKVDDEMMERAMRVAQELGGYKDYLRVVPGQRLVLELEGGMLQADLTKADPMKLYREVNVQDDESIARCFMVMAQKFLRAAIEQGNMVWWMSSPSG